MVGPPEFRTMGISVPGREDAAVDLGWNEVTGAVGDAATVLPVVVAVAVLTDLTLPVMLVWFGVFQVVWGLYYGVPVSVEPMKALAALVIAGAISTGELVVAGLLLAAVLLVLGATKSLDRVETYVGQPVVRGVQLGVALVLLETGLGLGLQGPRLAAGAGVVAIAMVVGGFWKSSGLVVFGLGVAVAVAEVGLPSPALPPAGALYTLPAAELTPGALEATVAQLAMTVGNAALATAVLLGDFFDRDVSADDLSTSMGVTNAIAVPLGGLPMCHGSGGVAGKYAFGARTAGANLFLGVGYVAVAVLGAGLVTAYPVAVLGVILALVALQLGKTSLERAEGYPLVVAVGLLGLLVNLGAAFVAGAAVHLLRERVE
jgi:MFS superfamily sulfate permease-like transporter